MPLNEMLHTQHLGGHGARHTVLEISCHNPTLQSKVHLCREDSLCPQTDASTEQSKRSLYLKETLPRVRQPPVGGRLAPGRLHLGTLVLWAAGDEGWGQSRSEHNCNAQQARKGSLRVPWAPPRGPHPWALVSHAAQGHAQQSKPPFAVSSRCARPW